MKSREHIEMELERCEEELKDCLTGFMNDTVSYEVYEYWTTEYENKIKTLKWVLDKEDE